MKKDFCMISNKPCRTKEEAEAKSIETGKRSYLCNFCDWWYMTTREPRENTVMVEPEENDLD